jgi:hypothetical protein
MSDAALRRERAEEIRLAEKAKVAKAKAEE